MTVTQFLTIRYRSEVAKFPKTAAIISESDYVKRNRRHVTPEVLELIDPETGLCRCAGPCGHKRRA